MNIKPTAIVFLGNPGKEYELTRHNAGFQLCSSMTWTSSLIWQKKFKGEWTQTSLGVRKIWLLKPLTMMNLSGESVQAMGTFFKIPEDLWVAVYDDLELPFGEIRFQKGGGLGGHNGLRSLKQHLGTDTFFRLRLGIGRPSRGDVSGHVLSRFSADEEIELTRVFPRAEALLVENLN